MVPVLNGAHTFFLSGGSLVIYKVNQIVSEVDLI